MTNHSKTETKSEQVTAYYLRATGEYGLIRRRGSSTSVAATPDDRGQKGDASLGGLPATTKAFTSPCD